jgi:ComF family protein
MVESWTRLALDCLFPRSCPPCDGPLAPGAVSDLCPACTSALVAPRPTPCARCGGAVAAPTAVCTACLHRPPAFVSAVALGEYRADSGDPNVLARTVQCPKYRRHRTLVAPLAELLAAHYPFAADALLVPVPLHPARLRSRGFNQAFLLARALARRRSLALAPRVLVRVRPTEEHAGLGAEARRRNVRDAFRTRPVPRLAGRSVVLVDDVLTTGATADACARALLAAGAGRVDVYTVGRTG